MAISGLGPDWSDDHGWQSDDGIIAQAGHGFQRHVAGALDGPLVVLFEQDGAPTSRTHETALSTRRSLALADCRVPQPCDEPSQRISLQLALRQNEIELLVLCLYYTGSNCYYLSSLNTLALGFRAMIVKP